MVSASEIENKLREIDLSKCHLIPHGFFNLRNGRGNSDLVGAIVLSRLCWLYQPSKKGGQPKIDPNSLLRTTYENLGGMFNISYNQMKQAISRLKAGGLIGTNREVVSKKNGKSDFAWEIWPVPAAVKELVDLGLNESNKVRNDTQEERLRSVVKRTDPPCRSDQPEPLLGGAEYTDPPCRNAQHSEESFLKEDLKTLLTPVGVDGDFTSELEDLKRWWRSSGPYHSQFELKSTVQQSLIDRGFDVRRSYPVADRGDGREGRIDLVATRGSLRVAIQCDNLKPRKRSFIKLRQVDAIRIVLLRNAWEDMPAIGSADHIFGVGIDPYSDDLPIPESWSDDDLSGIYRFLWSRGIPPVGGWHSFANRSRKAEPGYTHVDGGRHKSIWGISPMEFCAAVELASREKSYVRIQDVSTILAFRRSDVTVLCVGQRPDFEHERALWRHRNGFRGQGGVR